MEKAITQGELKKILHYDNATGIFTRLAKTANCMKVGDVAGYMDEKGYIRIMVNGKTYKAHRLAWLYMEGYFPEHEIDHEDQIKHHNWWSNLREFTRGCNQRNIGNKNSNTSGVKGLSWEKRYERWLVRIKVNHKSKFLGRFTDFAEAVCQRLAAEQCLGWEKSESNSPAALWVKENVQTKMYNETARAKSKVIKTARDFA